MGNEEPFIHNKKQNVILILGPCGLHNFLDENGSQTFSMWGKCEINIEEDKQ